VATEAFFILFRTSSAFISALDSSGMVNILDEVLW